MGYMVQMDDKGDAEGNYTLIARRELDAVPGEYGLFPIGMFQLPLNGSQLPVNASPLLSNPSPIPC